MDDYKLVYVSREGEAYFVTHDRPWGDDWNDAPYEHNAGPPYGEFVRVQLPLWYVRLPCTGFVNSPYSVEQINAKGIPWVTFDADDEMRYGLCVGATLRQCLEALEAFDLLSATGFFLFEYPKEVRHAIFELCGAQG
jgi:hypothetical protein